MMVIVVEPVGGCAEQRLYDAAAGWTDNPRFGPAVLIGAACRALVDGLDSPALRELAGASVHHSSHDLRELLTATLDELHIPYPGTVPPGHAVGPGGLVRRPATEVLRLAVTPAPAEAGGGFEVQVYVDGVEMTSAGAGLGMDPYDLLVPANHLIADAQPRTVAIARCPCGEYGCGSTAVTIVRDGDRVHWDWSIEVPMHRGVSFAADSYDAEVARVGADHSWETPDRTAGRLVLTGVDREQLLTYGLRPHWVANHHRDPDLFRVALNLGNTYQVFIDIAWRGRSPQELANEVCHALARPPRTWHASWHASTPTTTAPPTIAGPFWRRYQS
jgi:hypothetical protein